MEETKERETFFTRDPSFYKQFFGMLVVVALQNLVAFSINMADNIMLGSYGQIALSAATTVNQIFFLVQQFAVVTGNSLTTLCSQYWGSRKIDPIRSLCGISMRFSFFSGAAIILVCTVFSRYLMLAFTNSEPIIKAGQEYLFLEQWSFILFMLSNTIISLLRSVGTVKIAFYVSVVSLLIKISISYSLIFGNFGFPELGYRGAAIGTIIARIVEFSIVIYYLLKVEEKIHFHFRDFFLSDKVLFGDYFKVFRPTFLAQMLWAISVPMQTSILGHLSDDALAANSVSTTFFQYLKVIVSAMSATAAVLIGNAIGSGNIKRVKRDARTISFMDLGVGIVLGLIILALKDPLLSMYNLTPHAMELSDHLIVIMAAVMVGMAYEMPMITGIFVGSGDVKFNLYVNMISTWLIVMPLSYAAAFWWKWSVEAVVICIQSDQFFKGIPCTIRLYGDKWIHNMVRNT